MVDRVTIELIDPKDGSQRCFSAYTDRSLLHSLTGLQDEAIKIGCRGGGCGICKVKVIAGEYRAKKMSRAHVSNLEEANRIILACRITPLSDLILEVWDCDR